MLELLLLILKLVKSFYHLVDNKINQIHIFRLITRSSLVVRYSKGG